MEPIIRLLDVTKTYNGKEVVKNVSMEINKGQIYGFLGPNGAGKTTIMKMILNLVKPTVGRIEVFGETLQKDSYEYLKNIGSIIEFPIFYNYLTAYQSLELHCEYMGYYDVAKIHEVLDMVDLKGIQKKVISEFSMGMKQRLGIARAMLTNPKLLILDEPINGLDPIGIRQIRELLIRLKNEYGTTILISSHIISEIEHIADEIGVINDGVLVREVDMETVRHDNVQYIEIQVDDIEKAMVLLDTKLRTDNFKIVADDRLRIYDDNITQNEISKALVLADVNVYSMVMKSDTLEDYFMSIIKGGK